MLMERERTKLCAQECVARDGRKKSFTADEVRQVVVVVVVVRSAAAAADLFPIPTVS